MHGFIKTFVIDKGFGFITGEDGRDYFFHVSAFSNNDNLNAISNGTPVIFEAAVSSKGDKAIRCVVDDLCDLTTYSVPPNVLTSKGATIAGWDIIELGEWNLIGCSADSPDAARRNLMVKALDIGANALVHVEYFKTTGATGNYRYTIHNYRAQIATVARKDRAGTLEINALLGINQRAEKLMQELKDEFNERCRQHASRWRRWRAILVSLNILPLALIILLRIPLLDLIGTMFFITLIVGFVLRFVSHLSEPIFDPALQKLDGNDALRKL